MEVSGNIFQKTESENTLELVDKLQYLLADHIALYVKTLNCHWNVVDPRFHSLHEMFEEQYLFLAEQNDQIAERIRQLGSTIKASLASFSKKTSIHEIDQDLEGNAMLQSLIESYAKHITDIKNVILQSDEEQDVVTSDILTQILGALEKSLWMLKSHR